MRRNKYDHSLNTATYDVWLPYLFNVKKVSKSECKKMFVDGDTWNVCIPKWLQPGHMVIVNKGWINHADANKVGMIVEFHPRAVRIGPALYGKHRAHNIPISVSVLVDESVRPFEAGSLHVCSVPSNLSLKQGSMYKTTSPRKN